MSWGGQYGGYGGQPPQQQNFAYQYQGQPTKHTPPGGQYGSYQPAPPPGVSPELWQWFQAVDQDRSGRISVQELQQALLNGNWQPFNEETCRLMIGMFDREKNGTIGIHDFAALWKYIQDWKACFEQFDTDRSGNIDVNELQNAFRTFGYTLSMDFSNLVIRRFSRDGRPTINFDSFIQTCVMLHSLTNAFRFKDRNQSGIITIHYEEFLEMVIETTIKS